MCLRHGMNSGLRSGITRQTWRVQIFPVSFENGGENDAE